MNIQLTVFLASLAPGLILAQNCESLLTGNDIEGPFYEPDAPSVYEIAPSEDLEIKENVALVTGKVFNKRCEQLSGVIVEIWHAGGADESKNITADYTFPPDYLWYRGQTITIDEGYSFLTTYAGIYDIRPIRHYHFKFTAGGKTLTTQMYFRDDIPPSYEDYVKDRDTQFPQKIEWNINGSRRITWNVYLDL